MVSHYSAAFSQKVGVVLSGGGANGLAHVGVLQALEDSEIPIDYIAGTSMGAIVGGLYAAGYSPKEIEVLLTSEEFIDDIQGELSDKYIYYFKQARPDAAISQVRFSKDTPLTASLPTNVVSPFGLDFKMIEVFAGANAVSKENFDNLFVPFRCVASDIKNKKVKTFNSGQLNMAIRASATYPFYYKPVLTNNELLFDGGLYNNFPVDVLIENFNPDIIIGSNVSYNYESPTAEDLVSQIKNILVSVTDYSLRGKPGVIIEPKIENSAFNFSNPTALIREGFMATIEKMEELKPLCKRTVSETEMATRRKEFNSKKPPLIFNEVSISSGLNRAQGFYIKNSLYRKNDSITYHFLRPRFLKLFQDEQLKYVYPTIKHDSLSAKYALQLQVEKEKDFQVKFGGNFSSKPINTGFLSLKYNYLSKHAYSFEANSYFGKYYGSVQLNARMQTTWKIPISLEAFATLNRWDYFRSKATFFEEIKPSYILQEDKIGGLIVSAPVRYKSKVSLDYKFFEQDCNYYLTEDFSAKDTADLTRFDGNTIALSFERSTLNKRQWASAGTFLKLQFRYLQGNERTVPGSTALAPAVSKQFQDWVAFSLKYDNYFKTFKKLTFGFHTSGIYNSLYLFSNYKASLIFSPAFQPIPESKTLFLNNFRANKFLSVGASTIITFSKTLDYRIEAYIFQPINKIEETPLQRAALGELFKKRFNMLSTSMVYHSPFGPVSLSLNYYDREKQPVSFIFNFGYILFNRTVNE